MVTCKVNEWYGCKTTMGCQAPILLLSLKLSEHKVPGVLGTQSKRVPSLCCLSLSLYRHFKRHSLYSTRTRTHWLTTFNTRHLFWHLDVRNEHFVECIWGPPGPLSLSQAPRWLDMGPAKASPYGMDHVAIRQTPIPAIPGRGYLRHTVTGDRLC